MQLKVDIARVKSQMKAIFKKIPIIAVLLGLVFWAISSKVNKNQTGLKEQDLRRAERIAMANTVSAMIEKNNAVVDWKESFKKRASILGSTYTIEIQDAIIKTGDRPVLFFASINDIVRKGNKYYLAFNNHFDYMTSADIHFVLECTQEQVEKAMSQPSGIFQNFAIIAKITDVKKVMFLLEAESGYLSSQDVSVIIRNKPSNAFVVNGDCVDIIFVGGYDNNLLKQSPKSTEKKVNAWQRIWRGIWRSL